MTDETAPSPHNRLGHSRIFTPEVIDDIHVKSELGRYRMRGFSMFKPIPHWDELTNYFQWRRRLERSGHRFQSECDSEVIAVYLAEKMSEGMELEEAMHKSLEELDGVFTYMCVTEDALGVAKDEMAAKPLVLYESDDLVAVASEEIAIRAIIDHEIDTYDPYEGEVLVWKR